MEAATAQFRASRPPRAGIMASRNELWTGKEDGPHRHATAAMPGHEFQWLRVIAGACVLAISQPMGGLIEVFDLALGPDSHGLLALP